MTNTEKLSVITGRNLKKMIKQKGFTQEEFAEKINVDHSTLRRWLAHGLNSIDNLQLVSIALEVSLLNLIKENDEQY